MRKLLIIPLCLALTGCGLFKSERQSISSPEPRLNSEGLEAMQEQAKANYDLARWVRSNGVKPNDERAVLLEDGTRIIVRFFGEPINDVDGTDVKQSKRIQKKSNEVAKDYREEVAEHRDVIFEEREDAIHKTNLKWDFAKILGFFGGSTVFLIVAGIVLSIFFPVIIPIFSIFFQLLKGGISAFTVFAKLGVTGVTNIVGAIESFRNNNANTEARKTFDEHMSKVLDQKDKDALDNFKNHYSI